jgi:hypothetical protein
MKANGILKQTKEMEREFNTGQTVQFTKVIGKTVKLTEEVV